MSSIGQNAGPVPLAEAVAGLISLSDERDRYLERILRAELRGYLRGRADGFDAGYEQAERDMAAAWAEFARPMARSLVRGQGLQARRWALRGEPRTRATFGQPHPDDYRGGVA